jgi:hypothetical protein
LLPQNKAAQTCADGNSPLFSLQQQRTRVEQQYLTIWDLVLTPLYLVVLIFLAKRIRDKRYPQGHPLRRYFLPGLLVKFGGAIFIALVYQFYYGSGDTFLFFEHCKLINSSLNESVTTWVKLLLHVSPDSDPYLYQYTSQMHWYNDPPSYTVVSIGAVFGLLNGTSYIPISLLFAFASFSGIWAMFTTFAGIYPSRHKQLAIAFLFIPSTFVWGSAMFKDTICMFGLGWMTYTVFHIFMFRDFSVRNLFLLALSFYLVAVVKIYILMSFLPALSIWLLMNYSKKIRSSALRKLTNVAAVGFSIVGMVLISQNFADELGRYSLDKLAVTAKHTQGYISDVSEVEGGSVYDLGEFEPTILGMVSKFPQAVVVTLFRPFIWEIRKPIMVLSAVESFAFTLVFLLVLFKIGIRTVAKAIASDPNLLFFFVYSLIFAFAVGISTGNFGSLSRYKIPCMPFFAAFLMLLYFRRGSTIKSPLAAPNLETTKGTAQPSVSSF